MAAGYTVHHYQFVAEDGSQCSGTAYSEEERVEVGSRVLVTYAANHPGISRIDGMDAGVAPWAAPIAFLLFMVAGVCTCAAGLTAGVRARRLLAHGREGAAVLKSSRIIGQVSSGRSSGETAPIYRLTFEFRTQGGHRYETSITTEENERLRDDALEPVLYLPTNPRCTVLFDALPGRPTIDEAGNLVCRSRVMGAFSIVLPLGALVAWSAYVVHLLS